jgi:hypothetical protein
MPGHIDNRDSERIEILGDLHGEVMIFQPMAIKEISHGGAQIETGLALQVDSLHDFRLTLGERSVVVKGRRRHCRISDVEQEARAVSNPASSSSSRADRSAVQSKSSSPRLNGRTAIALNRFTTTAIYWPLVRIGRTRARRRYVGADEAFVPAASSAATPNTKSVDLHVREHQVGDVSHQHIVLPVRSPRLAPEESGRDGTAAGHPAQIRRRSRSARA